MTKLKVGDLVRTTLRKEFGLVMKVRPPVPGEWGRAESVLYVLYASGRTGHWFESDLEKA